jgi:hypothetical protein
MDGAAIGHLVHFRTTSEECRAALVVGVWNPKLGVVDLSVFLDGPHDGAKPDVAPLRWVGEVRFDEFRGPGTWHLPEAS